jgi:HEAT repeat protein
LNVENWNVKIVAVEVLGQLGEWAPWQQLLCALKDKNKKLQLAAAQALGQLVPLLIKISAQMLYS